MPKAKTDQPPAAAPVLADLDATLVTSALGMEALMDLMAQAPAEHRVRTRALHALMVAVADQLEQAHAALRELHGAQPGPA